jgi:hypothetical protein
MWHVWQVTALKCPQSYGTVIEEVQKVMTPWSIFMNLGYLQNKIKLLEAASLLLNIDVRQSQPNSIDMTLK